MNTQGQIIYSPPINYTPLDNTQEEKELNEDQKFDNLIKSTEGFEYRVKASPLFELFPNEIIIDFNKVSFIDKTLLSKNATSIFIKDIAKVEVTNDFFYATLEIINVTQTISLHITHLRKNEAREAQALIHGLMISAKNNIDITQIHSTQFIEELIKIGSPFSNS